MYNSKKRKRPVDTAAKTTPKKRASTTNEDATSSPFLIDGIAPAKPSPQLLAKKTDLREINGGPGRHRSEDTKGLIMELIDDTYPPLVCPICLSTSSARSEADAHFKNEHKGTKVFECLHTQCDQSYSSKPGLRYHLEHAHQVTLASDSKQRQQNEDESKTKTPTKGNVRFKKAELSAYLQEKFDQAYDATTCPSCDQQFKRKTHVINHLVEEHYGEEPYKCIVEDCKRTKKYSTREGLLYHLVSYHDEMQQ